MALITTTNLRIARAVITAIMSMIVIGCDKSSPPQQPHSQDKPSSASSAGTSPAQPWFKDIATESGLKFQWQSGHRGRHYQPEIINGGAALFDMDGDGDLDAYLVQAGSLTDAKSPQPPNQLFRNRGDGTFEDVTSGSGADVHAYSSGVACGDFDNDGDIDIYITCVGPNVLLANDGHGHFTDVTAKAGVPGNKIWGSSAAFVDYDADGDLDLFVANYINWSMSTETECFNAMGAKDYCDPSNYAAPSIATLYRNEGNGTFTDVTATAGIDARAGTGLGVVCGDFNNDGKIDIFVANDGMPNHLWVNRGDGTFLDGALQSGCALDEEGQSKAGMGVAAADIDDDGDLDLLVCNLAKESDSLFRNEGNFFTDATTRSGLRVISRKFTRFGMAWADFDNDGFLDLYEANGKVVRQDVSASVDPYAEPNLLFRGGAGGVFTEFQPRGGTAELLVHTSRAAAFGDVDNDGAIDILVVNRDAQAYLLHNIVPKEQRGHWIMLRVVEEHNRDAYGATVKMKVGNRTITRDVRAAYSYMASNDPRVHVGLGSVQRAEEVSVRWVDGTVEAFGGLDADQIHVFKRGAGKAAGH